MVKMPQRQRHNTGGGTAGADLPLLDPGVIEVHNTVASSRCCVPLQGGCLEGFAPIFNATRVVCSSDDCNVGTLMHNTCFSAWEQYLLGFLRSCGRARSWSGKQRQQNLWTKRGYDLAYKACGCLCGKGRLRKDLNYISQNDSDEENRIRRKKKNKNNNYRNQINNNNNNVNATNKNTCVLGGQAVTPAQPCPRIRTNSLSSTGSSPPSDSPSSPLHQQQVVSKKKEHRNRHGSGSGIFARRLDFSVFNVLPRSKINSYHIKMEDDGYHGNDETRSFILSTLSANKMSRVGCCLCRKSLLVYDRYPLIDGTFFLTSVQHSKNVIAVEVEERRQYLSAVCMGCLEGWNVTLRCTQCHSAWDGSSLILGTMYSFDVFAALPCCRERLQCSRCHMAVIPDDHRLPFFSEFSRSVSCPNCGLCDTHFVKSILTSFFKEERRSSNANTC